MAQKAGFTDDATSARTFSRRACADLAAPEYQASKTKAPDAAAASGALMKSTIEESYFFAALTGSLTPSTVANSTL
jgi:hypothetical protein